MPVLVEVVGGAVVTSLGGVDGVLVAVPDVLVGAVPEAVGVVEAGGRRRSAGARGRRRRPSARRRRRRWPARRRRCSSRSEDGSRGRGRWRTRRHPVPRLERAAGRAQAGHRARVDVVAELGVPVHGQPEGGELGGDVVDRPVDVVAGGEDERPGLLRLGGGDRGRRGRVRDREEHPGRRRPHPAAARRPARAPRGPAAGAGGGGRRRAGDRGRAEVAVRERGRRGTGAARRPVSAGPGSGIRPARASATAAANAAPSGIRAAGSFASARVMTVRTPGGRSAASGSGSSRSCLRAMVTALSPSKAGWPARHS